MERMLARKSRASSRQLEPEEQTNDDLIRSRVIDHADKRNEFSTRNSLTAVPWQ